MKLVAVFMVVAGILVAHAMAGDLAESPPKTYSYLKNTCSAEKWHIKKEAKDLLLKGEFGKLTKLAKRYRDNKETLSDGSWKLIYFYEGFRGGNAKEWIVVLDRLEEWGKSEVVDPSPIVALGDAYWGFGKRARGSGYANTVTEEGWRLLRERLAEGRSKLLAASERCRNGPGFYVVMLKIGIDGSQPRESFMRIFEKGIEVAPECPHLYEMKSYYILPRWYGRKGELEDFVRATAEKYPEMALWVLWRLQYQGVYRNVFEQEGIAWDTLKERLTKCIDGDSVKISQANILAYLADFAGDRNTFSAALDSVDNQIDASMWRSQKRLRQLTNQNSETAR